MNYTYCDTASTIDFCTILFNITKITSNAPFASGELQRKKGTSDSNYTVTRIIYLIIIYRLDREKNVSDVIVFLITVVTGNFISSYIGWPELNLVLGNHFLMFINSMTYFHTNLTFIEIWPLSSKPFLDNI